MRSALALLVTAALLARITPSTAVAAYDPEIDRAALQKALNTYSICQATCSAAVAKVIVDESLDEALDLIASIEGVAALKDKLSVTNFRQTPRASRSWFEPAIASCTAGPLQTMTSRPVYTPAGSSGRMNVCRMRLTRSRNAAHGSTNTSMAADALA